MWGFGQISNSSDQILMFDYAVGADSNAVGEELNSTRGNAIIEIGSLGAMYFTDMGHQPGGPHYWAVDVQFGDTTKRWWYDGSGVLDVAISPGGLFLLSGQGQTISGSVATPFERGSAAAEASPTP